VPLNELISQESNFHQTLKKQLIESPYVLAYWISPEFEVNDKDALKELESAYTDEVAELLVATG
jgi:methionine synthase II (cobalamin-independent)